MSRWLAAVLLAALLAAIPSSTLAFTCTRSPGGPHAIGVTQPFDPGVVPRGVQAFLTMTDPPPNAPYVYSTSASSAGLWIDSSTTNGSAWIGYRINQYGVRVGRYYYVNSAGTIEVDNTFTIAPGTSDRPFEIRLVPAGTSYSVTFKYLGASEYNHTSSLPWHNSAGTVGATLFIGNRASMMWAIVGDSYFYHYLIYRSQHGTGQFTTNSTVQNSSTLSDFFAQRYVSGTGETYFVGYDADCSWP